jgi:hypothetical protein
MWSGGNPPGAESMRAPIRRSGSITRRIGRFDSEASPISVDSKRWPESNPVNSRIPVPALPQSSASDVPRKPCNPTPCTTRSLGPGASMRTPSRSKMRAVARVSSPSRNPVMRELPSASAASITARCEIDLSPGTVSVPESPLPARANQSLMRGPAAPRGSARSPLRARR